MSLVRADGTPPEAFLVELRKLRDCSGRPSFRKLSALAERRIAAAPPEGRPEPLPPSTVSEVLAGKRLPGLPRWGFVEANVVACLRASGEHPGTVAAETARWRERWSALAADENPAGREPADREAAEKRLAEKGTGGKAEEGLRKRHRRWPTLARIAAVFLLGVGVGVAGTERWHHRPPGAPHRARRGRRRLRRGPGPGGR